MKNLAIVASDISRQMRSKLMSVLKTQTFKAQFDASNLNKKFPQCLLFAFDEAAWKTWPLVAGMFKRRSTHLALIRISGAIRDGALRELGTQQMRLVLRTVLELRRVFDTDGRVVACFRNVCIYLNRGFTYRNAESYVQLFVCKSRTVLKRSLVLQASSIFEHVIYFRSLSTLKDLRLDKKIKVLVTYKTEMRTAFPAQLMCSAWKKFMKVARPGWKLKQLHLAIFILPKRFELATCSTRLFCWLWHDAPATQRDRQQLRETGFNWRQFEAYGDFRWSEMLRLVRR